uniref:Uncharacterized protein n=1 Tax=Utricularia reniformis TaxID=192314 RepID=A0A1Y0B4U5_9LAMI|nr:hypothetical protein AEK19_MT2273 [Utricularia reniformis]ART32418.1 hypothetical protein AEK19_MT2273 [Utricularia reniformis]
MSKGGVGILIVAFVTTLAIIKGMPARRRPKKPHFLSYFGLRIQSTCCDYYSCYAPVLDLY